MPNLTKEQLRLLKWMSEGHTFEVCSDYCPSFGDVQPKPRLPIKLQRPTIHKLLQEGLVSYTTKKTFGLRWDVFSLTEKGRALT